MVPEIQLLWSALVEENVEHLYVRNKEHTEVALIQSRSKELPSRLVKFYTIFSKNWEAHFFLVNIFFLALNWIRERKRERERKQVLKIFG